MYSQNDEERVILALCGPTGKFLDIGAWDGITFSNTRALADRGWTGVLVEPSAGPFRLLQAVYPNGSAVLINAAVGLQSGTVTLYESDDAVSTTQPGHYELWKRHAKFTGRREVRQVTIPNLMAQFGPFDFVNIDTEGTSVDLLKTLDLINMKPSAVCVEHDNRIDEIRQWASERDYSICSENQENVILKCGR